MADLTELGERFHELRRALNGVVLQLEVARLAANGLECDALDLALERVREQARRAADAVDIIEREILG